MSEGEPTAAANGDRQAAGRYYPALDALRGIAALAVLAGHYALQSGHPIAADLRQTGLAVDFFFILSGFIIAEAYEQRLLAGMTVQAFLWKRAVRLYPLVFAGIALGLVYFALNRLLHVRPIPHPGDLGIAVLFNALLLPFPFDRWWSSGLWPLDRPLWSLFFEALVNLLYALLLRQLRGLRIALPMVVALALLVWFARFPPDPGRDQEALLFGFARAVLGFGLGVVLSRLWRAGRLPRVVMPGWIGLVALALLLWAPFAPLFGHAYDLLVTLIAMPLLMIAMIQARQGPRALQLFRWLGLLSYPLYAIHDPLLRSLHTVLKAQGQAEAMVTPGWALAAMVLPIGLSLLVAHFYDVPVRAWLHRRFAPRRDGAGRLPV